jgi:hypothetical protein
MSFLLIVFVSVLVLVVGAAWIVIRAIELTFHGVAWTMKGLLGSGNRHRHRRRELGRVLCGNDRCNAALRKDARFCHRCGQARHPRLLEPHVSREMSRVA